MEITHLKVQPHPLGDNGLTHLVLVSHICYMKISSHCPSDAYIYIYTHIYIQSSAVITRSNLSRYYIRHFDNSGKTQSDIRITVVTPYLTGELWGVYGEVFWHCTVHIIYVVNSSISLIARGLGETSKIESGHTELTPSYVKSPSQCGSYGRPALIMARLSR